MPLPVDYGTGIVTGTFTDTSGDPVVGTVSFTPSASRLLGTGAVILGDPVVVELDAEGSLSVTLPASDDPNVSPTDFTYRVDETFVGTVGSTYFIDVLEGVTLDLADVLVPGTVNNGTVIWTDQLPSQTGNAGKLLRTDGTDSSWAGLGSVIADASAKVTPVGADEFVMSDSAAAGVAKRISFTDLSAAIGGGAVTSVNGQTGTVVLDADDIGDGTTNKAYTAAEQSKLAAITGTNTGDQTLPTLSSLGAVPTSRTLAGLDLSADRTASALRTALGLVIGTDVLAPTGSGASLTGIYVPGGTDVAVADGGTGASTAAGALTNLGAAAKFMTASPATLTNKWLTPGVILNGAADVAMSADFAYYEPWVVLAPITIDALGVAVQTGAAAGKLLRLALFSAGARWTASGAAVATTSTLAADVSAYTRVIGTFSPVTLAPGMYVAAYISDGAPTLRAQMGEPITGSLRSNDGSNPVMAYLYDGAGSRNWTSAGFPSSPTVVTGGYSVTAFRFAVDCREV